MLWWQKPSLHTASFLCRLHFLTFSLCREVCRSPILRVTLWLLWVGRWATATWCPHRRNTAAAILPAAPTSVPRPGAHSTERYTVMLTDAWCNFCPYVNTCTRPHTNTHNTLFSSHCTFLHSLPFPLMLPTLFTHTHTQRSMSTHTLTHSNTHTPTHICLPLYQS